MKSTCILFLSTLFVICSLTAQPVVTSDILFTIGDAAIVHYANGDTPFEPGVDGPNVSWDFSDLTTFYTLNWMSMAPDDTPFLDTFPQATISFFLPADGEGNTADSYAYYQQAGNTFAYLGSVLADNGVTSYFTLTVDTDNLYDFPLNYLDSSSDDLAGTNTILVNGQTFITQRSGTSTTEVDAYGTLQTPVGTFTDVLRVKRTESITETFNGLTTTQEIERYDWLSPNYEYILLHTEELIIFDFLGNEQSRTSQTYFADPDLINSSKEVYNSISKLKAYPSPASAQLHLELPDAGAFQPKGYRVYSASGQIVTSQSASDFPIVLSLAGLTPGTYIIEVWNDEKRYQQRFIKN